MKQIDFHRGGVSPLVDIELELFMLWYFGNIFGMLGVALIATAFFRQDWQAGVVTGALVIMFGAIFHGLSLPIKRGKK